MGNEGSTPSHSMGGNESFGSAFARNAREQGPGATFTHNGQQYTTDRADGRDMRGTATHTYTREALGGGSLHSSNTGKTHSAHSGGALSGLMPNGAAGVSNYGQTPTGTYTVTSSGIGTGGIHRAKLAPDGHNAQGRTHLQLHEQSTNPVKAALNADSRGCIVTSTEAAKNLKVGDKVVVKD